MLETGGSTVGDTVTENFEIVVDGHGNEAVNKGTVKK